MTHTHLVVIKIGGSIITDKSKRETPNTKNIATFAENLSAVRQKFPDADVLLGNGAGSFGHHSAHYYGLRDGAKSAEQFYGVSITHNSVRELNLLVANALTDHDIPAYALSPGDVFTAKDGDAVDGNSTLVAMLLQKGLIPVIHGDTVIDTEQGVSIFSTEKSLFWLADTLKDRYDHITVIMVVDTGGVLDEAGDIISELKRNDSIVTTRKIPGVKDVTGGITHKIATCREATAWANDVYILGNTNRDLLAAFAGKPAGTKVL